VVEGQRHEADWTSGLTSKSCTRSWVPANLVLAILPRLPTARAAGVSGLKVVLNLSITFPLLTGCLELQYLQISISFTKHIVFARSCCCSALEAGSENPVCHLFYRLSLQGWQKILDPIMSTFWSIHIHTCLGYAVAPVVDGTRSDLTLKVCY
jgi:hypothetical protein